MGRRLGYDIDNLRLAVASSTSKAQVLRTLGRTISGSAYRTLDKRVQEHGLDTSHFLGQSWQKGIPAPNKIPLELILVENSTYTHTNSLKKRLTKEGILVKHCYESECGLTDWLGKPIVLHLDHINGKNTDNRIENLRLLCPNCHTQTETYCRGQIL